MYVYYGSPVDLNFQYPHTSDWKLLISALVSKPIEIPFSLVRWQQWRLMPQRCKNADGHGAEVNSSAPRGINFQYCPMRQVSFSFAIPSF